MEIFQISPTWIFWPRLLYHLNLHDFTIVFLLLVSKFRSHEGPCKSSIFIKFHFMTVASNYIPVLPVLPLTFDEMFVSKIFKEKLVPKLKKIYHERLLTPNFWTQLLWSLVLKSKFVRPSFSILMVFFGLFPRWLKWSSQFWTLVYLKGSYVITPVCLSVGAPVRLWISQRPSIRFF